jgi:proline utilization trans-activator
VGTNNVRSSLPGSTANVSGNVLPSFENTHPTDIDANGASAAYPDPGDADTTPDDPARLGLDIAAETEHDSCNRSTTGDQHFTNPLVNGPPAFTADEFGEQCAYNSVSVSLVMSANMERVAYLGTSSNWSFGRRVLVMVHESLFGLAPPPGRLLFEGQAYEVDWQGASTANMGVRDTSVVLPTSDFALFLINTVKFRCGQLFHLFDEDSFMQSFSKFHSNDQPKEPVGTLWYSHYLLILALGKALVVIFTNGTKPAGSDLFVEAMRMLPDVGLTAVEPIQSMEILCCAALYLQCLDKRKAAYNQVSPYSLHVSAT